MRLFNDGRRRVPGDIRTGGPSGRFRPGLIPALVSALALSACATGDTRLGPAAMPAYGPQDDYPVVVGEPYEIAGKSFTPEDVLNYDEVGLAAADDLGGDAVSGSHHTLPLPSYVEVTSLETGRTILVRLERRGPMDGQELIALSPGAMTQLGGSPGTPVRVRRVNPPEDQRTLLRMGQAAAPRMDTPMSLVEILRRRLPGAGGSILPPVPPLPAQSDSRSEAVPAGAPQPVPTSAPADDLPPPLAPLAEAATPRVPATAPASPPEPAPARAASPTPAREGRFLVQVAAFSTAERAERAARALGGQVTRAGAYFRVRTGPFVNRREAEGSLAKVRAAGYSDARILTSG